MSDDERIQLMILVKEGKLSVDEAVATVKKYRDHRRLEEVEDAKCSGSQVGCGGE